VTDAGREFAAPAQLDIASGQLTFVVDAELEVDEATLDPTGTRLAYALNRDGEAEVIVRSLASGMERSVSGLPRARCMRTGKVRWPGISLDNAGDFVDRFARKSERLCRRRR